LIYFIVNNDFHIEHIEYYTKQLPREEVSIIAIPHTIKRDFTYMSNNIISFPTQYAEGKFFKNIFKVKKLLQEIDDTLTFNQNDKIVLLSEFDPLNLYIVYKAKKSAANTFLLQEGIATYYTSIKFDRQSLNFKQWCILMYMRYVIGFRFLQKVRLGDHSHYLMNDQYLDKICLYHDIPLGRKIDKKIIKSPYTAYSDLDKKIALFLNQPLYQAYWSKEVYFKNLSNEVNKIMNEYEKIIFKFHPRDSVEIKNKIISMFGSNSKLVFEDTLNLPETMQKHKPLNAFSFFSDSLLQLDLQGCNVHYLFHSYTELLEKPALNNINKFIEKKSMNIENKPSFIEVLNEED